MEENKKRLILKLLPGVSRRKQQSAVARHCNYAHRRMPKIDLQSTTLPTRTEKRKRNSAHRFPFCILAEPHRRTALPRIDRTIFKGKI